MKKVKLLLLMQPVKKLMNVLSILSKKISSLRKKWRLRKQKKRNKKELIVFTNCEELPAWRFFKILKTGELRYLLDCKILPEYYTHLLEPIWDQILIEFDQLNKTQHFTNAFKDFYADLIEQNEVIGMKACIYLMECGNKNSLIYLRGYGFDFTEITPKNIWIVENRIKRIDTKRRIRKAKEKSEGNYNKPDDNYIKGIVEMSNILGRNIDFKITIAEWIFLHKDCDEIIKARKKAK